MNNKPLTRRSFKQAISDMKSELTKLRNDTRTRIDETWVVGTSELDTKENRRLNFLLGLDSNEGINQWYLAK